MYPIAIVGNDVTAWAAYRACRLAGFDDVTVLATEQPAVWPPAMTLPAAHTKVLHALNCAEPLTNLAWTPDREQVRLAHSGYLISELPLGEFVRQRHHAPHLNIETDVLLNMLRGDEHADAFPGLEQLLQHHAVVLVTEPLPATGAAQQVTPGEHSLWYACSPQQQTARANLTWTAADVTAWQFSTPAHTHHFYFTGADLRDPAAAGADRWHPQLHQPQPPEPLQTPAAGQVREHWYEGRVVYLGQACYTPNLVLRESLCFGLEDAWVLSRMLENYEEDIDDGLAQYQRYRRPRVRRIARAAVQQLQQSRQTNAARRLLHNLNLAFSTRFLPEIAMQKIDWLYGYDCIRGFR